MERLSCDRMFVAVMETGSFAKAAVRAGTSPGQASKMISRLELDLGVRLLNRTTRALSPTEVGQAYFERIKRVLDDLDALDDSIKSQSGVPKGKLNLTAPMSFGTRRLSPVLIAFAKLYPAIELEVNFGDRIVNLVDEGFDAGIRIGMPADSSLIARKLCGVRTVLAASPRYLAKHGEPMVPDELSSHSCIVDTNYRNQGQWHFSVPGTNALTTITVNGSLRFSSAEVCLAAVEADLGITRVPSFMAGPCFKAGRLKPVLGDYEHAPAALYVIYPPGRHLALKVRVLVDFLADQFKATPEWDQGW